MKFYVSNIEILSIMAKVFASFVAKMIYYAVR